MQKDSNSASFSQPLAARDPARRVQGTLLSYLGLSPPDAAQPTGFVCEKPDCPLFGKAFGRKTELTNHLRSKEHGTPSVKRPPPATEVSGCPIPKKPRHQYSLSFKRRVIDAFQALSAERGSVAGVMTSIADRYHVEKQRVSDWWKDRERVRAAHITAPVPEPDDRRHPIRRPT
eukprot:GHVU01078320.1.p1 GENE.GHVU01078320.1~~GHVU01078320.1.p1  ORF type:complete len:174 (+),score=7.29 GHVU01078320.1:294-815(+)